MQACASPTKPTTEGVGEIEAHPSRIPAVGPTCKVGVVLLLSGAPFS